MFTQDISLNVKFERYITKLLYLFIFYTGWLRIKYLTRHMRYLRSQWSDFKNSGSCLILTLLCLCLG